MRLRPLFWLLVSVVCFIGAFYFWKSGNEWQAKKTKPAAQVDSKTPEEAAPESQSQSVKSASTSPLGVFATPDTNAVARAAVSNRFAYRLSNTSKSVKQLAASDQAILLENALIDSSLPLNLNLPDAWKSQGDPGTYIVQARGSVDKEFRSQIENAGATIISYIPNNAFLIRASAGVANSISGAQAVLPFEPYYKVAAQLLQSKKPLTADQPLNVLLFSDASAATTDALVNVGGTIHATSRSPFGQLVTVSGLTSLPFIAGLSGVQRIEPAAPRVPANDLSRQTVAVASDSIVTTNYLNLSGSNVMVTVVDTGIDSTHPALLGRVFGIGITNDTIGHGTHVAGIIAGNGAFSDTVTNAPGSIMPPTTNQFRGMAPAASLFSMPINSGYSDLDLQGAAARTNALISNNSWGYQNDQAYDIAAASYDAAVRDALPDVTGSQPVLFVFSAGNSGNGSDSGSGVTPGSIISPSTAKNLITVGALEQLRNLTNETERVELGVTNKATPWAGMTDSDNEVARFSSRGNVGVDIEGEFGRFKPDVVAPGVFVVSTRSAQWDQAAYYNPTNYHYNTFIEQVRPGAIHGHSLFLPYNTVEPVVIQVTPIVPDTDLPIYYRRAGGFPTLTTYDILGTNQLSLLGNEFGPVPATRFYGIGNPTSRTARYEVTTYYATTNDNGNFFQVLSNMNNGLGPYYRYESGTSMSAPVVSGLLAMMQDYFTNTLKTVPSPALLKAMLINGARTVNASYDLQVRKTLNDQGWGLPSLTNSLPLGITNGAAAQSGGASMLYFDQSPTNALATGDSRTFNITVDPTATNQPLRFTLVWTDPPGNPAAGIKLVNDLDLIVTNLDSLTGGEDGPLIYFGNDYPAGSSYTFPWDTNSAPVRDGVNNVENVFVLDPVNTHYSVTVKARRVNVNAVTGHTNNVTQDFALVISSGNGAISNAISLTAPPADALLGEPQITVVTNDFGSVPDVSGQVLMNQRVGANPPLLSSGSVPLGSNTVWSVGGTNGVITLGVSNQWHFYVVTNTTGFSNAAFAVFLPPTLSIPRMGVTNYQQVLESTRVEADIDLYVLKNDPSLLTLNPAAIAAADKSVRRKGTEFLVYTNAAQNDVYYVGVHSEDQQAAEYEFLAMFSLLPFSDENGNMRWFPLPAPIPDGTPNKPGGVSVFGINPVPLTIRRVVVTNNISHERMDDLFGQIQHDGVVVALNNHSCVLDSGNLCRTNVNYIYEDNDEGDISGSQHVDGPGSLTQFVGEAGEGVWILTEVDNAFGSTGVVNRVSLRLDAQDDLGKGLPLNIQPNSFRFASIDVPPEGTNLTICVLSNSQPLQLYVRRGDLPTLNDYDYTQAIPAGGACLTIDNLSSPPLQPGRYYIGVYNPNATVVQAWLTAVVLLGPNRVPTIDFTMFGPQPIPDDAVSYSTINVPFDRTIARVDVDVAIQHPRISDMALTLISPSGKRILLSENRGGNSANMGNIVVTTNYFPTVTSGGANAATNVIALTNSVGILVIDFDFLQLPDSLDVFYGTTNIYSTGLISGKGNFSIPFGPGSATNLTIIVNKDNNPGNPRTAWEYTARIVTLQGSYFTFSENTNFTQIPIKFAQPPFVVALITQTNSSVVWHSSFEQNSSVLYTAGMHTTEGWSIDSGDVDVVTNGTFGSQAAEGIAYLDLNGGSPGAISTNIATSAGKTYQLSFAYARNPDSRTIFGTIPIAQIRVNGALLTTIVANNFNTWNALGWQTNSYVITATSSVTPLSLASQTSGPSGVLFDAFNLVSDEVTIPAYYFPEENLKDLEGENAKGEWKLEMWDNRAGATVPIPQLLSWQLRFIFDRPVSPGIPLQHDVPVTNTVAPCQAVYYSVTVPPWAKYITNTLIYSTAPVKVWANTNQLPGFGGTNVGDFQLFATQPPPITGAVAVLNATNIPSGQYFIAVENPCGSPTNAQFAFKIEFDTTALTNGIPVTSTNGGNNLPRYFSYDVSSNATAVSFLLTNMSGNFDLVVHKGGPLPPAVPYDYGSFNPGTLEDEIIVFTNSTPVPLTPGRWYIGVYNTSLASNVFTIVVNEFTNSFATLITLTNGIPYTNSAAAGGQTSYRYIVSSAAVRAQFEINNPSGDMTLVASKGLPLPSLASYDYLSGNPGLSDELIVVLPDSQPVPLTPGQWFLTAVNVSGAPVNYSIKATEWQSTGQPIVIVDTDYNPPQGTNGAQFCLTWNSLPGIHYYVQGLGDLRTTNWTAVSPTITAVDYTTTYCVPIGPTNQFFRVVEGLSPLGSASGSSSNNAARPQNFSVKPQAGAFQLQWTGTTNSQYQVQWSTNLASGTWTAFTPSNMTSTNGLFSFLDDSTQLGGPPPPPAVFYRVLLWP